MERRRARILGIFTALLSVAHAVLAEQSVKMLRSTEVGWAQFRGPARDVV